MIFGGKSGAELYRLIDGLQGDDARQAIATIAIYGEELEAAVLRLERRIEELEKAKS
jgi:hypothetical protein